MRNGMIITVIVMVLLILVVSGFALGASTVITEGKVTQTPAIIIVVAAAILNRMRLFMMLR